MTALKYKVIKSKKQYNDYLSILKELSTDVNKKGLRDEIELLTVLIDKWDRDQRIAAINSFEDPISLVRSLMAERNLRAKDLVEILGVSKGLVSDILNYKKGLSNQNIRILADYFKVDIAFWYSYKS